MQFAIYDRKSHITVNSGFPTTIINNNYNFYTILPQNKVRFHPTADRIHGGINGFTSQSS